jgi:hypothetical protein
MDMMLILRKSRADALILSEFIMIFHEKLKYLGFFSTDWSKDKPDKDRILNNQKRWYNAVSY